MPAIYNCPECNFHLSLGWYHGVSPEGIPTSSTSVACLKCGAQYTINQDMGMGEPEFLEKFDVKILSAPPSARESLKNQLCRELLIGFERSLRIVDNLPFIAGRGLEPNPAYDLKIRLERAGAVVELITVSKTRNQNYKPPGQDRIYLSGAYPWQELPIKGPREGPTGTFKLSLQPCVKCGAVGSLTGDPPAGDFPCPNCKKGKLQFGGQLIT